MIVYSRSPYSAFVYNEEFEEKVGDSSITYVANLLTSEIIVLEGTGAIIWEMLDQPMREHQLLEKIAMAYQQTPETVKEPTHSFLELLTSHGLLETRS